MAKAAGLDPRRVWQNVDEALIRQFIAEQRAYQNEAKGAPLARWATLFSADVGFAADGTAYLYENLLMPQWKRPGCKAALERTYSAHLASLLSPRPLCCVLPRLLARGNRPRPKRGNLL